MYLIWLFHGPKADAVYFPFIFSLPLPLLNTYRAGVLVQHRPSLLEDGANIDCMEHWKSTWNMEDTFYFNEDHKSFTIWLD